ncbi:MAG: TIR domain-containing protein [Candidatus Binatia bacterium]
MAKMLGRLHKTKVQAEAELNEILSTATTLHEKALRLSRKERAFEQRRSADPMVDFQRALGRDVGESAVLDEENALSAELSLLWSRVEMFLETTFDDGIAQSLADSLSPPDCSCLAERTQHLVMKLKGLSLKLPHYSGAAPSVDIPSPDARSPAANAKGLAPPLVATRDKPRVFIASSREGLAVAERIQQNLSDFALCKIWTQGAFALSATNIESLEALPHDHEFAVIVMTPDDIVLERGEEGRAARDNVIFELGLFIGALTRRRTFMICPRDVSMHLPTDLAGVTLATYETADFQHDRQAALGAACTTIKDAIKRVLCQEAPQHR